jgi:hypothetical protein
MIGLLSAHIAQALTDDRVPPARGPRPARAPRGGSFAPDSTAPTQERGHIRRRLTRSRPSDQSHLA